MQYSLNNLESYSAGNNNSSLCELYDAALSSMNINDNALRRSASGWMSALIADLIKYISPILIIMPILCQAQDYTYTAHNGYVTITKYIGEGGDVVVPTYITGSLVDNIGPSAFSACYSLNSVSLPRGITNIGDEAFYYCVNMKSVTFSNRVKRIGARSFNNCSGLYSVELPESIIEVGENAFGYCTNLSTLIIREGVRLIKDGAFEYCTSTLYK